MLNIGLDVNINLDKTVMPIYFEGRNECTHCGSKGTLIFVDKFGRETNKDIHPFDHIKCIKCNTKYSINWKKDEKSGNMYPTAVDPSIKQEFMNIVTHKTIKQEGNKSLKP